MTPRPPDDPINRFSPTPEQRPGWTEADPVAGVPPTPERWFEPIEPGDSEASSPVAPPQITPPASPGARRPGGILGLVLAASLVAAALSSAGTFLALRASGALDRGSAATIVPSGQPASSTRPIAIDESSAIIDAAARVSPAVVRITSVANPSAIDPLSIPQEGVGSGVIFDANGWILTNRHVVAGSDKLTVELKDGHQYDGTIYGIDTLTDLAIVKIDATGLPTASLGDSSSLKVGQLTIAIGSPLGTYSNSVTSGILSATGRTIQVDGGRLSNLLQTDTAINPGNSGGPLLDAGGNVIGINTAVARSAEGIGFAIPINIATPIMQQALAGEKLARPYIGIRYETIDYQVTQREHLSEAQQGALVGAGTAANGQTQPAVVVGSPADKAGIKEGDIITSIDGIKLDTEHPLGLVLSQFAPGRTVTLEVFRGGSTRTVQVTLGTRPSDL